MPAQRTSAPALPTLGGQKRNYRERVADALRAALIAGELRPGEVYSAPTLAARFGVSATPVREAMLDLVREGLVDTVPNKGFRVTAVSEKQLDEYTHIRSLIEIPTTAGLATTADPIALEALRPTAQEIVTAATAGDLIAYVEADIRFHLGLLALALQRPPGRGGARPPQALPPLRPAGAGRGGPPGGLCAGAPGDPGRARGPR